MLVYEYIKDIKWISYSQIKDLTKIAEGRFGVIYKATLLNGTKNETVMIKRFLGTQYIRSSILSISVFIELTI